jgi:hypothetical protein
MLTEIISLNSTVQNLLACVNRGTLQWQHCRLNLVNSGKEEILILSQASKVLEEGAETIETVQTGIG